MTQSVTRPLAGTGVEPDAVLALVDHCLSVDFDHLPESVVAVTRNQVLDTLGIGVAGSDQPGALELREITVETAGKPEARIWGTDIQVPAQDAARVNATMAHALDYDDTHEHSFVHPSVITIPAALAVADMLGSVTGREVITAIALGVDVACRLAAAARPGVSAFEHGWHNTTLYGYFAAAAVSGKLMGLTRSQMVSALGIAFHQAAGNSQAHVDGALTKRMGPGFASYGGLLSARLAQRGVQGATSVLEGERGFFRQYHDNQYSRDVLLEGLGSSFAGAEVSFKPWPSCRGSHTAADAALAVFTEAGIEAADVECITVYNGPGEFPLLSSPLAKKQRPASVVEAQFSIPWTVAAALVDRRITLEHFTAKAIQRSDLLAATQRIRTAQEEELARPGGGPGAARIELLLKDGRRFDRIVSHAKGEPGNPMSVAEFHQKFLDCTQLAGMTPALARELLGEIGRLETLPNAGRLTAAAVIGM